MTPKQRLLAAIKGQEVDRIPWSPFLAYFWEAQTPEIQQKGQMAFLEEIGADPLFRGSHLLFSVQRNNCIVKESATASERIMVYETPVGTIKTRYVYSPTGNSWFLVDHAVKTEEDFKVLAYIYEDMSLEPELHTFEEHSRALGENGLYVPLVGTDMMKTSFQSLVEHWVGTEELVYALTDYPETVEECLGVMRKKTLRSAEIAVQSSAESFIFWEDSSTTNISPAYFEKYAAPEINAWGKIIHDSGKFLLHHACGHLRALLPQMTKTPIDMIESISPPPTGNVELWEAREVLPEHIGLIGGIEPTVFLNSTMKELEEYVYKLIEKVGNKRFILANSDSCPPGVEIEKFKLIGEIVRSFK